MDTGDGAQVNIIQLWEARAMWKSVLLLQSGEDTDRELDCMLELPAARKPLNSPEEVAFLMLSFDCGDEDGVISTVVKISW